jgi:hypothetical protein
MNVPAGSSRSRSGFNTLLLESRHAPVHGDFYGRICSLLPAYCRYQDSVPGYVSTYEYITDAYMHSRPREHVRKEAFQNLTGGVFTIFFRMNYDKKNI